MHPSALNRHTETIRRFENYYDNKWVPKHEYFRFHRKRFVQSVEFLDDVIRPDLNIADLVQPGDGPGPIAEFFSLDRSAVLTLITSDLRYSLSITDRTCDVVLCTETIEHIKDIDSTNIVDLERFNYSGVDNMLSEIARILKPTGLLFITTPNATSYIQLYKWLMGELPYMDPVHVREFTVDILNQICGRNGFLPDRIEVKDSWESLNLEVIAACERLLAAVQVKRAVSRAENIYALYRKELSPA